MAQPLCRHESQTSLGSPIKKAKESGDPKTIIDCHCFLQYGRSDWRLPGFDCGGSTCGPEVFVIDNASTDGSVDFIKIHYPWVHLLANRENRGFAAANNQVLPVCQGRMFFFSIRIQESAGAPSGNSSPL